MAVGKTLLLYSTASVGAAWQSSTHFFTRANDKEDFLEFLQRATNGNNQTSGVWRVGLGGAWLKSFCQVHLR
jgi:hypothetical protein